MSTTCFILLGTNMGNKLQNLQTAREAISSRMGELTKVSGIYETAPWGETQQDVFLNQVLAVSTAFSALETLDLCLKIEQDMGRIRYARWKERLIDIDLLYYDQAIIREENLTVPHPYLHERRFTLVPLVEIAPGGIHPKLGKTNTQLLNDCPDTLAVQLHPETNLS